MRDVQSQWQKLDAMIQAGSAGAARAQYLDFLNGQRLDRPFLAEAARFAHRLGVPYEGIRLLAPVVRPTGRAKGASTPQERAEYAACLLYLDVIEEARGLLSEVNPEDYPRILLYRAFTHFRRFENREAIPYLVRYHESQNVDEYARLVALTNIAEALIYDGRSAKARRLLSQLLKRTRDIKKLYGNNLGLCAQNEILEGNWNEAHKFLQMAHEALRRNQSVDGFYVAKWQAILDVLQSRGSPRSLLALRGLRKGSLARKSWSSVRDCDLYEAIVTGNKSTLKHLHAGTPWPRYREWIRSRAAQAGAGLSIDWAKPFVRRMGPASGRARCLIDVDLGAVERDGELARLKPGQLLHRCLLVLASDFYSPISLSQLHASLFADSRFNMESSPLRVHQALHRLREWLERHSIPLGIAADRGGYSLVSTDAVDLRIRATGSESSSRVPVALAARTAIGEREFCSHELARALEIHPRKANRLIRQLLENGAVRKLLSGPATRYRWASDRDKNVS